MAVKSSARSAKTYEEYKAERRETRPSSNPLDDYRQQGLARTSSRGIPQDWPFCTCGADICPDKGLV
ncbi:hypothetical protein ACFWA9_19490 [Kitasatospora sp. NPDC059973]|uniref:hypothetical protein n=1 Tax=Kitasatospora sp. NPDC059973 TaxID=3347020 RepID=UPI0036928E75